MDVKRLLLGLLLYCCANNLVRAQYDQQQYCSGGGSVYYEPGTYSPRTCSANTAYYSTDYGSSYYGTTSSKCPQGYTCLTSTSSYYSSGSNYNPGQAYCCSYPYSSSSFYGSVSLSAFCPPNSQLWSSQNGVAGNALSCQVVGAFCQSGYTCQQSPYSSGLYCCSTGSLFGTGIQFCPAGSRPLYQGTSAQACSTYGYAGSCPVGYSCYDSSGLNSGSSSSRLTGYCCTIQYGNSYGNSYGKRKRRQVGYGVSNSFGGFPGGYPNGGIISGYGGYATEQTDDSRCPTAVVGVTCSAGSSMCAQYGSGFVCQYVNTRRQFRCCSSSTPNILGRKKRSAKNRKIVISKVPSAK